MLKKEARPQGYTKPGYEPSGEDEWDDVHVVMEKRQFNPNSGQRLSKPKIVKVNTSQWPKFYANRMTAGLSINEVLHRPKSVPPIKIDPWDNEETQSY